MTIDVLENLKKSGEAPEWMEIFGYKTLLGGYLLPNETPKQMYRRLAKSAASYYKDNTEWEKKFFNALWRNWLCPSSPVAANLGTSRGLPISCNSIHPADNLDSIFMKNHELAILSKNGAGVGIYFGDIRGRGAKIKGNGISEGIVPWAKVMDQTTSSVSQGCYDDKTEVLTSNGWVNFSNLNGSEKVAQVTKEGVLSFTEYTDYISYPVKEDLYKFTNITSSIDLLVTGNHRMALERRKRVSNKRNSFGKIICNDKKLNGYLSITEAEETNVHRDNRFWVSARGASGTKEILTALDQFLIAYQADGSTLPCGNSTGEKSGTIIHSFHFSKERKINRLKSILNELKWDYKISYNENDLTTTFFVKISVNIKISKKLEDVFNIFDFSSFYAEQFIEEIALWDGCKGATGISYSSVIEKNVDFVQAIAFIAGRMSISGDPTKKEEHHQLRYKIYICKRDSVGGEEINKTKEYYEGNVYCVTVPTGLLVVRRNGSVVICGNSTRRGASAIYLPIDHLDIEEFLNIRRPTGDVNRRCLNINHGVCISNEWMESMLAGDKEKRSLYEKLLTARVETGEPYIFFTDNVNNSNPECYKQNNLTVKTSNICSEITLFTDHEHSFVCCLSSLNLVRWDEWKDTDTVNVAVRFLDAVLSEYIEKTESIHGMEASRRSAIKGRAIGIGVLGFHSLLQEKGLPFDSFETMQLNAEIFRSIHTKSEEETAIMAKELGEPEWCKGFNRRHTHLQAIAPTVSNSTISGGHSAGIEPLAANIFSQKSAKGTFIRKNPTLEKILESKGENTNETWKSINEMAGSVQHLKFLSPNEKEVYLTAREINQHTLVKLAAQRQRWVDQAQSLNLFFASNASVKYIHEVHIEAWKAGLKTLYYCRSEGVLRGDLASRTADECKACEG